MQPATTSFTCRHLSQFLTYLLKYSYSHNIIDSVVCYAQKYNHVTHLLRDLQWFRLAVLVFAALTTWHLHSPYLLRDLQWTDKAESLRRLRSGSQQRLIVPRTPLRTIGDRSFRVTAARNSLPTSDTTATPTFLASLKRQLKHFFSQSRSRNFSLCTVS